VFHHAVAGLAAMDRLGPRLHDEELLAQAIHRPFHIHGAPVALLRAVVFLDGHHAARDLQGLLVGDAETVALRALDRDRQRRLAGLHAVHHLPILVAQLLLDDAAVA